MPVLRTFISLPAGIARMNFAKFTIYTVIGCAIWAFAFTLAGYRLGESWEAIEDAIRPFSVILAVAFAAAVAWFVASRVRKLRAEGASGPGEGPTGAGHEREPTSEREGS
jgi:membrane protein DedA with SNARE-associated domain